MGGKTDRQDWFLAPGSGPSQPFPGCPVLTSPSLLTKRVVKPAKAFPRASPRVSNKVNFLKTNTYKPIEVIPVKKAPHCAPAIPQH